MIYADDIAREKERLFVNYHPSQAQVMLEDYERRAQQLWNENTHKKRKEGLQVARNSSKDWQVAEMIKRWNFSARELETGQQDPHHNWRQK